MYILTRLVVLLGVLFGVFGLAAGLEPLGLAIVGEAEGDGSGQSISLSADGSTLAVGAPTNDGNGRRSGHVRVYSLDTSNQWVKLGNDIDGEAASDKSGHSVSLSADGSVLAIGAPLNGLTTYYFDNGNISYYTNNIPDGAAPENYTVVDDNHRRGHVRVYSYNGERWDQLGQDIDGEAKYDDFGGSVSLSADGSILAVSAVPYSEATNIQRTSARMYFLDTTTNKWQKLGNNIDVESFEVDNYFVSLSADGSIVATSAPAHDNGKGQVRVFSLQGDEWHPLGQDITGENQGDQLGFSVSLSADGSIVAVGTPNYDNNKGYVRVYSLDASNQWVPFGADIGGDVAEDKFGSSVSLSADGSVLAVGAVQQFSIQEGYVRAFSLQGDKWHPLGQNITGDTVYGRFGSSVSLSADGFVFASSAFAHDNAKGRVRVFTVCDGGLHLYQGECQRCPVGMFSTGPTSVLDTTCSNCAAGSFAAEEGSAQCKSCALGMYASAVKSAECASCPTGYFAAEEGNSDCAQCPAGSIAPEEGSAQCTQCEAGSWSSTDRVQCTSVNQMLTDGGFAGLEDATDALASYDNGRQKMKSAYSSYCPA